MKDTRLREPPFYQLPHPLPRCSVPLAASPEAAPPESFDANAEGPQGTAVCRHRVVGEEAGDDLLQPGPLLGNGLVPAASQLLLDFLELGLHAVASGLPAQLELTPGVASGDKGEAQEVEGLRFAELY